MARDALALGVRKRTIGVGVACIFSDGDIGILGTRMIGWRLWQGRNIMHSGIVGRNL